MASLLERSWCCSVVQQHLKAQLGAIHPQLPLALLQQQAYGSLAPPAMCILWTSEQASGRRWLHMANHRRLVQHMQQQQLAAWW